MGASLRDYRVDLPFFPNFLRVNGTQHLNSRTSHPNGKLTVKRNSANRNLTFIRVSNLLFASVSVMVLTLAFRRSSQHINLSSFPLLNRRLRSFSIFQHPRNRTIFLSFRLLRLSLRLVTLLSRQFPIIALINGNLPLFFGLQRLRKVAIPHVSNATRWFQWNLLLLIRVNLNCKRDHLKVIRVDLNGNSLTVRQ